MSLSFDLTAFINTIIGAFLGGVLSLAVSYYFFTRSRHVEQLTTWLAGNLSQSIVQQQFMQFYGGLAGQGIPNEAQPADADCPRLEQVRFFPARACAGGTLEILCRVSDAGWNFRTDSGLTITDHRQRVHAVSSVGFGYMRASISIPATETPGRYRLTFDMHDIDKRSNMPNNRFTQTVNFEII